MALWEGGSIEGQGIRGGEGAGRGEERRRSSLAGGRRAASVLTGWATVAMGL